MFLKLNNDEFVIKGRVFTYLRKQQNWLSKEDASSPTVSTKGLMLSCMIDAMKYDIHDNIIYQDNQISIKLEKNGR